MAYLNWRSNIPLIYDWISHSHLVWPALSMCWGGALGVAKATTDGSVDDAADQHDSVVRALYYSTRTGASASRYVLSAHCRVISRCPASLAAA